MKKCYCLYMALMLLVMSGCAGGVAQVKSSVFFPPEPDLPRLQYLGGISNSREVTGEKESFSLFFSQEAEKKTVKEIVRPSAVAAKKGMLYVADLSGKVYVVDLPNKRMEELKGNEGRGKITKPLGIAVDDAGFLFVADIGRKQILVYNNKGEFLKAISGKSKDFLPTDVAVYDRLVYVLDTKHSVIHVVDPVTDAFLSEIGSGDDPKQSLALPTKLTIDQRGIIRVSNAGRSDVTSYDRDGHFLGSFGTFGDGFGQFARPKGLAGDANGYLYVVDAGHQNVQIFDENSRLLAFFGSPDIPVGGMNLPNAIALSTDQLGYYQTLAAKDFELSQIIFVANQFGDPKIGLYGLGKKKGIDYELAYRNIEKDLQEKAREELKNRPASTQADPQQPAVRTASSQ